MKRIISIVLLSILATSVTWASQSQIQMKPSSPQPRPRIVSKIGNQTTATFPVAAFVDENMLSVYFQAALGNATISITDSYGTVVEQITVDTYQQTEIDIPTCFWDADEYTISISYNSTTLSGVFQLE